MRTRVNIFCYAGYKPEFDEPHLAKARHCEVSGSWAASFAGLLPLAKAISSNLQWLEYSSYENEIKFMYRKYDKIAAASESKPAKNAD